MAIYTDAILAKDQVKLMDEYAKNPLRFGSPDVYKLLLKNAPSMFPSLASSKVSETQVTEMHYRQVAERAAGTGGRTHNHIGTVADSTTIQAVWNTYDDKFVTTLKQSNNKIWSAGEIDSHEIFNAVRNLSLNAEVLASDYVFNNRTASVVTATTGDATFAVGNQAYEIDASLFKDQGIHITQVVMKANHYGMYDVICDFVSFRLFGFQANQGANNDTNTSFQFQGINFILDDRLFGLATTLSATYDKGVWTCVPRGTVSAMTWIPKQNREGVHTSVNDYGSLLSPVTGEVFGTHTYEETIDGTTLGGNTQDVKLEVQYANDVSFMAAPGLSAPETTITLFAFI